MNGETDYSQEQFYSVIAERNYQSWFKHNEVRFGNRCVCNGIELDIFETPVTVTQQEISKTFQF